MRGRSGGSPGSFPDENGRTMNELGMELLNLGQNAPWLRFGDCAVNCVVKVLSRLVLVEQDFERVA